jgi:2'-5' RNA ligase
VISSPKADYRSKVRANGGAGLRGELGKVAVPERLSFGLTWLISNMQLRLLAGRTFHRLPPSGPEAASHFSVVTRPPQHIVSSVAPVLVRLREVGPNHYSYPTDTMHVTLGSAGPSLSDGANTAAHLAKLRAVIGSYPSFDLALQGLNVSPSTVFVQVVGYDSTLRSLRRALRMLGPSNRDVGVLGLYVRELLPHLNIVRFSRHVTADFLKEISRYRRVCFGRWTVREVEVMRTATLHTREGRQVLECIPLKVIH